MGQPEGGADHHPGSLTHSHPDSLQGTSLPGADSPTTQLPATIGQFLRSFFVLQLPLALAAPIEASGPCPAPGCENRAYCASPAHPVRTAPRTLRRRQRGWSPESLGAPSSPTPPPH